MANALALADLVTAMGTPAAVLDRRGAMIVASPSWGSVADALSPLLPTPVAIDEGLQISLLDRRPTPSESIRAAVRGELAEVAERVHLGPVTSDGPDRFVEIRVAAIGDEADYVLVTCVEVGVPVSADMSWDLIDRHPLTGLPGRRLFLELLNQAMTMSDRHRYHPAVLSVGFAGLAPIVAAYGPAARDELIVAVASRLKAGLRPGDVVAQVADDEFAVLLPDVDGAYLAEAVSYRLGAEVARPLRLGDQRTHLSLVVGIATAESSKHPDAVLRVAEGALAEARSIAPDIDLTPSPEPTVVMGPGLTGARRTGGGTSRRIDVTDLRQEELCSWFQPIFDTGDPDGPAVAPRVVAGEALMRWRHPHYGVLSAGEFLGLAINSGMLATLTDQALVNATETWADFRDALGPRPPQLFVNLSPDQLLSRVAVDRLYHLLIATGLPPEDVVVEVTEEAMSTRFGEMLAVLTELRVHGLRVALDDFGSGYSSLGRLRHLPVDVIKVDQSMVRGLEGDRRAQQLLAAVSTMANELDVECVVEGIETPGEAQIVSDLGFRYVQGYHYARPAPPEDFVAIVTGGAAPANA